MSTWPLPLQEESVDYARHVRRSTMVDTVELAFAFCISAIDEEKIRIPQIEINPVMTYEEVDDEGHEAKIRYEVSVAGHA